VNARQPFGLWAASQRLLRRRSSTMSRIACVAAARIRWLGAHNGMARIHEREH